MKQLILSFAAGLIGLTAMAQTAQVQVVHNSPDDVATTVDVYLNGALLVNDFAYRTASPFIPAPAGSEIMIDIAPGTSTDVSESIYNLTTTLTEGATYLIVADGITGLSTTAYNPAPAFGLEVFDMGRESASMMMNTDVLVHHGSTDAPTVDVTLPDGMTLVDDASYPQFAGYLELPTADYMLDVRDATGTVVVASYEAPLQTFGLGGAAITVYASGFLDPAANGNGPGFGLFAVTAAGGDFLPLPSIALPPVNDVPCGAISVPTDGSLTMADNGAATTTAEEAVITPEGSGCGELDGWCGADAVIQNSLWYSFVATDDYVIINTCEEGNTVDTQLALYEAGDCADYSTFTFLGANDDTPAGCDLGGTQFASTLTYVGLVPGNTYHVLVDSYQGEQGPIILSVLNTPAPTARLQVIHNSADDIAEIVDVYLNGALLLDDFAYRTATPFVDVPALVELSIDIAPSTSVDVSESIYNIAATLVPEQAYLAVAQGITGLSSSTYTPAPAFEVLLVGQIREVAVAAGNTDLVVIHGSTDAPTVDVAEVTAGTLVDNIAYNGIFGYLELPTADYQLEVQTQDGSMVVATYDAPLASLGLTDAAITVLASGFLNPAVNSDGPDFGLFVALPAGGDLVPLPLFTNLDEFDAVEFNMYPNPADQLLTINSAELIERVDIYDTQGRMVMTQSNNVQQIDISGLSEGVYQVAVVAGERVSTQQLIKL